MKKFIFLFLLLWQFSLFAQINLTATTQNSTCSANGTINVTISGGTSPYNILLNGAVTANISTNTYTITGLSSGTYALQVSDNQNIYSNILNVTIGGNYLEPTLTAVYNNCQIEATVSNGQAPFLYAFSSTSAVGPFSPYQSSPIFTNIPLASVCYVRVKDACDNIYTTAISLNAGTYLYVYGICSVVDSATYDLQAYGSGGIFPYTFTCITTANGTQTNTTGLFTGLNGCHYTLMITDACGHSDTLTNGSSCLTPTLSLDCINCTDGSVSLSATGGYPPYQFFLNAGAGIPLLSNATGLFTGLPAPSNGQYYNCNVANGCNTYSSFKKFYCLDAAIECSATVGFDGQVDFSIDTDYLNHNPSFPIELTCSGCTPSAVTVTANTPMPVHFNGLMAGIQEIVMQDACNNIYSITSNCDLSYQISMQYTPPSGGGGGGSGGSGGGPPSGSGQALSCGNTLTITCSTSNLTFNLYNISTGVLYASNTTGAFPFIPSDIYELQIISPTGFLLQKDTFDTSLFFTAFSKDCRNLSVGACPSGLVFDLHDVNGNPLVLGNTTGIFNNLQPGQWYEVFAKDTISLKSISKWVLIDSAGDLEYEIINCQSLQATLTLPQNAQGSLNITYTLTGANTAYFQQNSTGYFPALATDNYTLTATRGNCDTVTRTFIIGNPFNPNLCVRLLNLNGTFSWEITLNNGPNANYFLLDSNANLISPIAPNLYQNLPPGDYTLFSESCDMYSFELPPFPPGNVTASVSSLCSNLACIQPTGAMGGTEWVNFMQPYNLPICGYSSDVYVLYQNGFYIAASSGDPFCNLMSGGYYQIVLQRQGIPLDTFELYVPPYNAPNLIGTSNIVCGGVQTANVYLSANGNGTPFVYEILNPPAGYTPTQISTPDSTTFFPNLPPGLYNFMVYDGCGASSDFSLNVAQLQFVPSWSRNCDGTIQLLVQNNPDWHYHWKDSAKNVIDTTYNPLVFNPNAATYTLVVEMGGCIDSVTINIPAFVNMPNNISVNAGNDTSASFPYLGTSATTFLQGNSPNANQTVQWQQLMPAPSVALIANPLQTNTQITVSDSGLYSFVYTIFEGFCSHSDTVNIYFHECREYPTAGIDTIAPFSPFGTSAIAYLNGQIPTANQNVSWQQIAPMPSVAVIANPTQANTQITVSATGIYTFIYKIEGENCAGIDTVKITFFECWENINAGIDTIAPFSPFGTSAIAYLNGQIPTANQNVSWQQIAPMPSVAVIANPTQANTQITVSATGIYTFIYKIEGENCAGIDTVKITFFECWENINAGIDTIAPFSPFGTSAIAYLNGQLPTANQHVSWQQIAPMPSVAVIANPTQANTQITVSATGIYTFIYKIEGENCAGIDTVKITFLECWENVNAGTDTLIAYSYQATSVTANLQGMSLALNQTGIWEQIAPKPSNALIANPNQANTQITVFAPGIYVFTYKIFGENCAGIDTVKIEFFDCGNNEVSLNITPESCKETSHNGSVEVVTKGSGIYTYSWNTGQTTQTLDHLSTGNYEVIITSQNGCLFKNGNHYYSFLTNVGYISDWVTASFSSNPTNAMPILLEKDTIQFLNTSQNAQTYTWSFGILGTSMATNPIYPLGDTGIWKITLYAANEFCWDTYSLLYQIIPNESVYIPSAFSPNGDNHNETFGPVGTHILSMEFTIFDRWGKVIFHTENQADNWDGTFKGEGVPEGVYTFMLDATLENGKTLKRGGTVTLFR